MIMPWLFIVLGAIFLLENLGFIPEVSWPIVWPVLLILAGVYMLAKKSGSCCCTSWFRGKKEEEKK
jgi:hypothetical protein